MPHLAEPFLRGDAGRQRSTRGVGLGLYLCRLVAQAHGGSLQFRNAQPGLEVVVSLPLKRGLLPQRHLAPDLTRRESQRVDVNVPFAGQQIGRLRRVKRDLAFHGAGDRAP